jgi:uncharacterized protein YqeY
MISDTITKKIAKALKAHDELRLSTLRLLSSALNYEFIAKQHKLSEEEELAVVKREVNKRRDTVETYEKLQNPKTPNAKIREQIDKEKKEIGILREYLPPEMSDEELAKLVDAVIAQTGAAEMKDVGRVIGAVMEKAKASGPGGAPAQRGVDGKKVAQMVKLRLT